jgi:hypothetical protein
MPNTPSPNMGIITPIVSSPGTDPGPTYATTVNTALGTTIDQHDHTSGKGKLITTAALNINADLTFNSHNITSVNTITATAGNFGTIGSTTLAGTITGAGQNITGLGTLTAATVNGTTALVASAFNSITLAGTATGSDPKITVAGDATRNLELVVPNVSTNPAGLLIAPTNGGAALLGASTIAVEGALWLGANATAPSASNYTIQGGTSYTRLNAPAAGGVVFYLSGTQIAIISGTAMSLQAIPLQQLAAATALSLYGNAAATGGTGIILDGNHTTAQTSGTLADFRTGGTSKLTVDFSGAIQQSTATALILRGNVVAAGLGMVLNNVTDVGGQGAIAQFQSGGLAQFQLSGRGHLIPLSTAPTAPGSAVFHANYRTAGAVNTISLSGSDASMILRFTTGTTVAAIAAGQVLVQMTLAQAYSSVNWTGMACMGATPGTAAECVALAIVPTGAGSFNVVSMTGFTPVLSTPYAFAITTMGAGAVS